MLYKERQDIIRTIKRASLTDTSLTGQPGLQGLKGDKGDKGDVGNQGSQGTPGNTGNPGVDGDDGAAGHAGTDGAQPSDLLALINYAFDRIKFLEAACGISYGPTDMNVPEQVALLERPDGGF